MTRKLKQALTQQKKVTEQVVQQIPGILGLPLDGQRRVEVSGRNAYVYVRLRNNESEVIQAFNNQVAPAYNLPVLVEREGNRYIVIGVDTQRYENNWNSFAPFLPRHGNTHSFDLETGGGGDVVWVYPRQFTPLLSMPSGSRGGPNVIINPYTLKVADGTWKYVGNTGTANITPYNPTSATGAIIVLVYVDSVSGNPGFLVGSGTVFNNNITGVSQIAPYIPTITNPDWIPDSAIRLITGTAVIGWDNIYDVRQFLHPTPTGTGGGSGGTTIGLGVMAQDEGVPLGTGTTFNFVGANVEASISGSVVRVFVTGSGGGSGVDQIGVFVQDEGVPLSTGTTLNFVGNGVDVTMSGTVARIHISGSSSAGSLTAGHQGFGYDYKIITSSVSGSMTVSLVHLDGSTPSVSNPLVFNIAGNRRECTSAQSFTIPTGTNWFNAGSSELRTLSVDYFVYAVWEGDGGSFGFGISRIPYAVRGVDFSLTSTNETYFYGTTTVDSNDFVEVIGRIKATLSGSSGFAWTASNAIFNLYRPVYQTDWLEWLPTKTGYSTNPTGTYSYKIDNKSLYFSSTDFTNGVSSATTKTWTLPMSAATVANMTWNFPFRGFDNGAQLTTPALAQISTAGATISFFKDMSGAAWTASGNHRLPGGTIWYPIA